MPAGASATYFISDLHLEASRQRIVEAFADFIAHTCENAEAIYILGDLLDSWIGDDHNTPFINTIKAILAARSAGGTPIYFIHGNRDFLLGEKFARDTGIRLLAEQTVIDLYGERVLLLHGDTLCTDDIAYQNFRRKVRDPHWQRRLLRYPLLMRKLTAAYFRYRSRRANADKATQIMDVAEASVRETLDAFEVRKMIHGHTHRPQRHPFVWRGEPCERIVLGDWESHGWYLKADPRGQELVKFAITQPTRPE